MGRYINVDIIHEIAKHAATSKELFSMSLCCRDFQDPCLNLLWKTMNSIVPLLKLLPAAEETQGNLVLFPVIFGVSKCPLILIASSYQLYKDFTCILVGLWIWISTIWHLFPKHIACYSSKMAYAHL
jgi:hypothetical protein